MSDNKKNSPGKKPVYLQQAISALLLIAVLVMLGWLSVRYSKQWDWTAGNRNTLTEASRTLLKSMDAPIRFIAFAYPGAENRASVEYIVDRYKAVKPDVEIQFIDPSSQPQKVREYNISSAGEVVIEYQNRRENLRGLSEQAITTALQRLAYTGESWIVFLEGHGERDTQGGKPEAFGGFAQLLQDKGLKVQPLNLVQSPKIPDNTAVLVVASPSSQLLEGEAKLVDDYVKQGGNLLWLSDPDTPSGLDAVAQTLGITWQNGFAVLPEYELLGTGHPGIYLAVGYPPSPVTQGIDQVTLFPLVRSLTARPDSGWQAQPVLVSSQAAWLETGKLDGGPVKMETDKGDVPGPLTIGLTLTREKPGAADGAEAAKPGEPPKPRPMQRVALIGDADFLSNAYLSQFANQQLGVNLIQWLAARDAQINVDVPKAPDVDLFLPDWALVALAGGFVAVLPLVLLGVGVGRWAARRRR